MDIKLSKEFETTFPKYMRHRQEDMMNLEASLARRDFQVVKKIGQKISVNAKDFGLGDLGSIAESLVNSASERKFEDCQTIATQMTDFIRKVKPTFV